MKNLSLFLIISVLAFTSIAQPANNACTSATALTDLNGGCVTVNNTGATFDSYTGACMEETNNIWFSFVAQGGYASISVSGVDKPEFFVSYAPTGNPCTAADVVGVVCADNTGNYTTLSATTNDLIVGEIYYIQVTNCSGGGCAGQGPVTICVTNPAAPSNDDCSAPAPVAALDGTCTAGTTYSSTSDSYSASCWDAGIYPGGGNTVWYSFVAQGYEATVDITSGANSYPAAAIYGVTSGGNICNVADAGLYDCAGFAAAPYSSTTTQVVGYPLTVGETYYVAVTMRDDFEGAFNICINNPLQTPGDNCLSAEPFCTGTTYTFPANTNEQVVDDAAFGCLASQANPVWYYMEIATAGNLQITMSNSNNRDIDFILWGPFTDVSTGCLSGIANSPTIEDCSYSLAATEVADITGAQVGETYIMLITNFSNLSTNITFSQTGGTGATDCSIVLPIELSSFDVTNDNRSNVINWTTDSEKNNDYFTVEYSYDGLQWNGIGNIDGAGNSVSRLDYSFNHYDFLKGINYYRLKQTDFDGKISISAPVSINNGVGSIEIVKTINFIGQEVNNSYTGWVIDIFSNGEVRKRLQ